MNSIAVIRYDTCVLLPLNHHVHVRGEKKSFSSEINSKKRIRVKVILILMLFQHFTRHITTFGDVAHIHVIYKSTDKSPNAKHYCHQWLVFYPFPKCGEVQPMLLLTISCWYGQWLMTTEYYNVKAYQTASCIGCCNGV